MCWRWSSAGGAPDSVADQPPPQQRLEIAPAVSDNQHQHALFDVIDAVDHPPRLLMDLAVAADAERQQFRRMLATVRKRRQCRESRCDAVDHLIGPDVTVACRDIAVEIGQVLRCTI